jgi:hypothetical protein
MVLQWVEEERQEKQNAKRSGVKVNRYGGARFWGNWMRGK